ncbi:MAG: UbiD family decarboxylase, partial [Planctomycetaceae bacterium]
EIIGQLSRSQESAPAVLFERVKGSALPVVVNLLGSQSRMCRALGVTSFEEIAQRISGMLKPQIPEGWLDQLKLVPQLAQLARLPPRIVRTGVCQQIVRLGRDVDLAEVPALQCWPLDAGPMITQTQVYTRHPVTLERKVGCERLQIKDRAAGWLHYSRFSDGCQNLLEYRRLGQQMPVAIALGGDPVCIFTAAAPLPRQIDACLLAGFLRNAPVELVKCRTIDLEVPAGAEIVIEGYIDPTEPWETAGPFGDRNGHYNLGHQFPVLHVTAVTHRANPVYCATVVGPPPQEEFWLMKAAERMFLPVLQLLFPEVVDVNVPRAGAQSNLCFVSIRKRYPQQARKVLSGLWGLTALMFTKVVVVVDEHVNVQNADEVWFQVGANVHPGRDLVLCEGPGDLLDHASPICGAGHKLGLDATRKYPEENHPRPWPEELRMTKEVQSLVRNRWREYGLPGGD